MPLDSSRKNFLKACRRTAQTCQSQESKSREKGKGKERVLLAFKANRDAAPSSISRPLSLFLGNKKRKLSLSDFCAINDRFVSQKGKRVFKLLI